MNLPAADVVGLTSIDDAGGAFHEFVTNGDFPGVGIAPCTIGQIEFDRQQGYGCDDTAEVTVTDLDLDRDPASVETVPVLLTSTTEPDGEWITLTEISPSNARFSSSVSLAGGFVVSGDGKLAVSPGDLLTATYHDADDGSGQSRIATVTSGTDCAGPLITDVRVTDIFDNRATVQWTTDEPATSRVEFGTTPGLGQVTESLTPSTSHTLDISSFSSCERVYFRVGGADQNGDDSVGATLALNLLEIGGVVFRDGFESDSGWTLEGSWERGMPLGLGSSGGDPSSAWSGEYVIGNDLSGQGAVPGDYEPTANESATSPAFSTVGKQNLELILRRKLGLSQLDQGRLFVHYDGFTSIAFSALGPVNDFQWTEYRRDISSWADDRSSVAIEFLMASNTASSSYGWNIDELIVKDSTAPDFAVCGGCAGGPGFAGVAAVHDPDPCGPGGLVISWEAAASWGTGTDGDYDVYRGTSPGFVPDESNRVASGLTDTTWTDTSAPVDTPVWCVVRARSDESCAGGEGLDDGNLVRAQATETLAQSPPAPVGSTLLGRRVADAHVRMDWAPVAGADHYVVRRGTQFDFSDAVDVGTTGSTLFEDVNAATLPGSLVYRVFAVNACGQE